MKLLSDFPGASMSMAASVTLRSLLEDVLAQEKISHVLETGTYLGLGSTAFVSEAFPKDHPPQLFVTTEANWVSWRTAKNNLHRVHYIRPLWGTTVSKDRALKFLHSDDVLKNHGQYPEIFIDNTSNPLQFYSEEIRGGLGGRVANPLDAIRRFCDSLFSFAGDNLLEKYLLEFQNLNPLVVLDSCGGIGYLEFTVLMATMKSHPFLVLLDDINHIKHFRSLRHIKNSIHFKLLGLDEQEGWLLARHTP